MKKYLLPIILRLAKKLHDVLYYCLEIVCAVAINCLIMPSMVFLTWYVMTRWFGVNFNEGITIERGVLSIQEILILYLCVGIFEEGMCRYLIQDCFLERVAELPKWLSLPLASAIFGAMHLANPGGIPFTIPQSVGAAFSGLWFGYLYRKRGLHFSMLTHGIYDFVITLLVMYGR